MDAQPSMRDLARQLLAANPTARDHRGHEAARVFGVLQGSLTNFAGVDGFAALMKRALALAGAAAPSLQRITLGPDGRVEGLDGIDAGAAVELATQLLSLLETFIGESLTLVLVAEAFPDASPPPGHPRTEADR